MPDTGSFRSERGRVWVDTPERVHVGAVPDYHSGEVAPKQANHATARYICANLQTESAQTSRNNLCCPPFLPGGLRMPVEIVSQFR
jgi:hypothetical protein